MFGPADVEKTWGVKVEAPPIPFSKEDLERAKELGQMLMLRIDKTKDGKPLSMEAMHEILQERFTREGKGGVFGSAEGWKNLLPDYFISEAPRALRRAHCEQLIASKNWYGNFLLMTPKLSGF